MKLSEKSLQIIKSLFAENSNLQLPVSIAKEILEIREWVEKEIKEDSKDK